MSGEIVLILCMVVFFSSGPSAGEVRGRQADGCTSGFMSLDRIEAVLGNGLGDPVLPFPNISVQAIVPGMNFTCDGSILSWTFGAQWEGHSSQYTELQIWRSSGNGSYTKVGNTTIMFEEENSTQLYQYTLTSPLPFQAGDILGYFQGSTSTSQLALLYEATSSSPQIFYTAQNSPKLEFSVGVSTSIGGYHVLISVETDSAGCDCGFMSVERMRILLGLEVVGDRTLHDKNQQITPDIHFTCDGLITKWIIGADWNNDDELYPELQLWRNVGNDTYHKINGTFINIATESQASIHEFDNFPPIPFLVGDILGMFQPRRRISQLTVWHERDNGPVNYYILTDKESPYDVIDLQNMPSLYSQVYHPLVTVEIVSTSSSSFNLPLITASSRGETSTNVPQLTTTSRSHSGDGGGSSDAVSIDSLSVGVGVAGALLALVTATVITVTVLVCLRKRHYKMTTTDNVAYLSSPSEVKLTPSAAAHITSDHSPLSRETTYMYVTVPATAGSMGNMTTSNKPTDNPSVAEAYHIPTSSNEAYGIATSSGKAHAGSDIPTSTNPAYQASTCQRASDDLTYDYISSADLGN